MKKDDCGWKLAILDECYDPLITLKKHKDIIVHAKLIHSDDYYEVLVPSLNYFNCFVEKKRIKKFL